MERAAITSAVEHAYWKSVGDGTRRALVDESGLEFKRWASSNVVTFDTLGTGLPAKVQLTMLTASVVPHCPIVVITALGDAMCKRDVLQAGTSAYSDKPVRIADLKRCVQQLLDHTTV